MEHILIYGLIVLLIITFRRLQKRVTRQRRDRAERRMERIDRIRNNHLRE